MAEPCITTCYCCLVAQSNSVTAPWTVAHQSPLSLGFPRQEHWSGWPFPSPGDLLNPGIEPTSPTLQVDSLPLSHQRSPLSIPTHTLMKVNTHARTHTHHSLLNPEIDNVEKYAKSLRAESHCRSLSHPSQHLLIQHLWEWRP